MPVNEPVDTVESSKTTIEQSSQTPFRAFTQPKTVTNFTNQEPEENNIIKSLTYSPNMKLPPIPNNKDDKIAEYIQEQIYANDSKAADVKEQPLEIKKVDDNKHARFDAKNRTYRYFMHQEKNPFLENSWLFPKEVDMIAMNKAAETLLGTQDFTSLSKLHTDVKTNICTIYKAHWFKENGQLVFEIEADRFLRNMVRATVGTLIEVGIGKLNPTDISIILAAKNRQAAKTSVPAHGLFLWDVVY